MTKCKFRKTCKLYSEDSDTCNYFGGQYYEDRMASCYNLMEKNKKLKRV